MSRIAFRNFTGGEVTPTLCARYDLKKFGSFLQTCRNFMPNLHGDVERRPGTKFISDLDGHQSVLIPFQFNTSPSNNYVLIFQNEHIKIAQANGLIEREVLNKNGNPFNPYSLKDVYNISFAQVGDVLYLAHPSYALRKITRKGTSPYDWECVMVSINSSVDAPGKPTATWHRGENEGDLVTDNESYKLQYKVVAVDADGVESAGSPAGGVTGRYPTDWVVGDYVTVTWPVVEDAVEYNVYRESAGYYGFIGVSSATDTIATDVKVNGTAFPRTPKLYRITSETENNVTTYKLEAGAGQHVYQGAASYYVWHSGTSKWWCVAKAKLSDRFLETDRTVWGGDGNSGKYPSGTDGGVTIVPTTQAVGKFTDENYEPDTATTPKKDWNPFTNGNNPSSVCFHQQRMWLGGGAKNPASIYASRTGDYESFRKSSPLQDDDALEYVLASGSIDDVKWIVSFDSLLIGTAGAEYKAASSKGSAITPSDCQITVQSYWGSRDLQPLIIGQSIMHAQRSGSHVRDLYYTLESDGYAGNDLSVLAPQLVETSPIMQWCYQQSPSSCVWAVRADGTLLCLTYMKEQNVFGWSRHVTNGKVKSVAVINGEDEDVVMMVVQRSINGETKYYLERLMPRFREDDGIADAWYVDAGKVIAGTSVANDADGRKVVCSGFGHLAGKKVQVLSDGSPEEHTVSSSGTFELEFPVTDESRILVGLGYESVLCPLPPEVDMDKGGSTIGKRRAYGKCIARMYRSVGGSYAASRPCDLWNPDAWKSLSFYELPFLPEVWGQAVQPYSGDLEISLPSGQDPDTSIWFMQDKPLPMRIVALTADVEFGEI